MSSLVQNNTALQRSQIPWTNFGQGINLEEAAGQNNE
jgi:hypothetical protein